MPNACRLSRRSAEQFAQAKISKKTGKYKNFSYKKTVKPKKNMIGGETHAS
jgi:hypothetical protein